MQSSLHQVFSMRRLINRSELLRIVQSPRFQAKEVTHLRKRHGQAQQVSITCWSILHTGTTGTPITGIWFTFSDFYRRSEKL